jgi:FAD binding domain/Berberine and berberine like
MLPGLTAFEAAIDGAVVVPGSPDYELMPKSAWAQFGDVKPAAVVRCARQEDVAETIAFARRTGIDPVPRGGGHCFAGRSSTEGLLVDLSSMRSVSVRDGIAAVGAGALLGDIYDRLDPLGLTIAAGACPSVGIAGLTLGGGLGILGRRYGLTSDQLVRAHVALADGRPVVCDEEREPDLFWALRGAGAGQLGVVTSFAFRTVPADDLTCFKLAWPYKHAASLIELWQGWAPSAGDELAASLLVNAAGDLREPVVTLFGAMLGTQAETMRTLDELIARLGADPGPATLEQLPHRAAKRFLAEHAPGAEPQDGAAIEPPKPVLMLSKSEFFRQPLAGEAIAALVEAFAAEREPGQGRELDFTPWGGAYDRERVLARDWLTSSWSLVHRWGSGGVFPNFPDPDLADSRAYYGDNHERLSRVKARYDPDNVFHFPQSLPPAGAS